MDALARFLLQVASRFFREDDNEFRAAWMDFCDHHAANFFWQLLHNGLFITVGHRGFLRLVSKLAMEFALVCQRRVSSDIKKELATEALQGSQGLQQKCPQTVGHRFRSPTPVCCHGATNLFFPLDTFFPSQVLNVFPSAL